MLPRQSMYVTNNVRKASVHYNRLWSITEPIPNRPRLHRDAPWKRSISTSLQYTLFFNLLSDVCYAEISTECHHIAL